MNYNRFSAAFFMPGAIFGLAVAKAADLTTLNFNLDGSAIPPTPNEINAITLTANSQLNEENRQVSESDLTVSTQNANVTETGSPLSPEVNNNLIFAEGIGNEFESTNFAGPLDLNDLNPAGGDGLIASGQLFAPTTTSSVSTTNGAVSASIDYTSTPVTIEGNRITAAAMGNTVDMSMSGDIPSGFTSSDTGSFNLNLSGANSELEGTATLQLASQQATVGLSNGGSDPIASTSDSQVRLNLRNSANMADTVNVNRNQIDASFMANDASLSINLGDDERSVFLGTLSAASVQNNIGARLR
ncbi:hypothetical protein [Halomonas sp. H10-9-1]|uniref:hypothetical protein n=1 Tax=Halomonas sp. H10-9-1 TaxID=2950871 RepID=UPI0032DE7CB3